MGYLFVWQHPNKSHFSSTNNLQDLGSRRPRVVWFMSLEFRIKFIPYLILDINYSRYKIISKPGIKLFHLLSRITNTGISYHGIIFQNDYLTPWCIHLLLRVLLFSYLKLATLTPVNTTMNIVIPTLLFQPCQNQSKPGHKTPSYVIYWSEICY